MNDSISRQAAIDALNVSMIFGRRNEKTVTFEALKKYAEGVRERIEALPSAQPGWIPTSERLPKPNEYENGVRKYYLVQNEYGDMMVCSWRGRHWMQMYRNTYVEDKVVAWMPPPAPYRPEGEEDDN